MHEVFYVVYEQNVYKEYMVNAYQREYQLVYMNLNQSYFRYCKMHIWQKVLLVISLHNKKNVIDFSKKEVL